MAKKYQSQEVFRLYGQKDENLIRILAAKIQRFLNRDNFFNLEIVKGFDSENWKENYIAINMLNETKMNAELAYMICTGYYHGMKNDFKDEIFNGDKGGSCL